MLMRETQIDELGSEIPLNISLKISGYITVVIIAIRTQIQTQFFLSYTYISSALFCFSTFPADLQRSLALLHLAPLASAGEYLG